MKISVVSDVHLEFGYQTLPGGDVLILAGDICEARSLKKDFHKTRLTDRTPGTCRYVDFFEFECAKYNKVFYVMGNHEHYHGRFDKTYNELKSMMPANVTMLEKECEEYEGVLFLGATLWTDLNKGDPITVFTIKDFMNDYRVVQNYYPDKNLYHKLIPEATVAEHRKTKEYFKLMLEEKRHMPVVVITHMAPSFQSVNQRFKHETVTNGGYASALDEFILDHENIRYWVHGHMHDPCSYTIGQTRVVSNPRGYVPWEEGNGFDSNFTFEVQ